MPSRPHEQLEWASSQQPAGEMKLVIDRKVMHSLSHNCRRMLIL